jgi:hypothetical protein
MDRCDQIRQSALAFAVEHHGQQLVADVVVIQTANAFHKFLLGGHESLTEKEVVEMEALIRADETTDAPAERTYTGDNVVTLPADMEAANG